MADFDWFELAANLLGILAVSMLAVSSNGKVRKGLEKLPIKKICWGILIVVSAYWFMTIPYVSRYYDFSNKLEYEGINADSGNSEYVRNHHQRIGSLERELKETKEELREFQRHYKGIVQIGWYAVVYYGIFFIIGKKNDDEPSDIIKLNLDK